MKLLLASRSETRRHMLQAAGVLFESVDAPLDEEAAKQQLVSDGLAPKEIAARLAELKAKAATAPADALVIGSDQVLERDDGSMLSKPRSREEAADQLRSLAGRTHRLHSAAVVTQDGVSLWSEVETVSLKVRPFSDTFLQAYLNAEWEHIRWSVGGYRIEGPGAQLFDTVEGSHFAILGMPLLPLLAFLREYGALPA